MRILIETKKGCPRNGYLSGYIIYTFDIDGDGRVEAITLNTIGPDMHLLVLSNTEPLSPEIEQDSKRKISPALYNCTRY